MTKQDWIEYRDAIYHSNIDPELTGRIMVSLDNYFNVLQDLDINTTQGARSYLISNGVDPDEGIKKGIEFIEGMKSRLGQ